MKLLKYVAISLVPSLFALQASAQYLCEARMAQNEKNDSALLENSNRDGRTRLEGQLRGYNIVVLELISQDQANPTLNLTVKSSEGIVLTTMLPAPGSLSGNSFVRTDLKVQEGYLTVKCINR